MNQNTTPRILEAEDFYKLLEEVRNYMVRIETPAGHGTGFFVYRNPLVLTVATAYHVIQDSYRWQFPIRITDEKHKETIALGADPKERFLEVHPEYDLAVIGFGPKRMPNAPKTMLTLMERGYIRKAGCEVGWCGYPAIPPPGDILCFFGGWLSSFKEETATYFVDGTVISGVSGGPCFCRGKDDNPMLIGVVTAYYPHYSMGQPLQGLGVVQAIEPFHQAIQVINETGQKTVSKIEEERKKVEQTPVKKEK